jgi:hypothetical protein
MKALPYQEITFKRFCQMDSYLDFITKEATSEIFHAVYEEEVVMHHYKTAQWNEYSSKHPFSD